MGSSRLTRWFLIFALVLTAAIGITPVAGASFGVAPGGFESTLLDDSGNLVNPSQAGEHPGSQQVSFVLNTVVHGYPNSGSGADPDGTIRTAITELPPGLVGNPQGVPQCPQEDFPPLGVGGTSHCPTAAQIGVATLKVGIGSGEPTPPFYRVPVYNLVPPKGVIARIGFVPGVAVVADISLRTGGDYGLNATVRDATSTLNIFSTKVTLWGVPADSSHDAERFLPGAFFPGDPQGSGTPLPSGLLRRPFMSNPTRCGLDLPSRLLIDSWQDPGNFLSYTSAPMKFIGCDRLDFDPSIEAKPTTTSADAPSGLDFKLHIPQNEDVEGHEDPDGLVTSHLRDAVVTLPEGMTVNPSSAAVLDACSLAQVGMSSEGVANDNPVSCPNASILGKATVVTPALDHPLPATVYLARQGENPFGSLLAMYLVIDDPESGILIKLPGKVVPDLQTGRLAVSFKENPQTPVEYLEMHLFPGPHASLKTPEACGVHTVTSEMVPWTAPEGETRTPSSSFSITNGPDDGPCQATGAAAANGPSFIAGTADSTAKEFSPFSLRISRDDGTQKMAGIDITLPPGLLAKLAGVSPCSELDIYKAEQRTSGRAEQANPSCPTSSRVGSVDVGAGAGPKPIYVSANAYLAGPYKGAPLSLAIVTPAVAGPFDLGNVVVRSALHIDPETAQVHGVSDPLPTILRGIPLNLRSVAIKLDRPDFTLNPTNCNPLVVKGAAISVFNQSAALSSPFQVNECGKLGFKPTLKLSLKGGTKRSQHPALRAVLNARKGEANIARTSVALPHSEFLAQDHIRTICTRVQFAAEQCPKGSIYGKATAITPLLDQPLSGPVYLRSSNHPLPDLVAALHGQIDVDLVGRIDSVNGGIRTTFASVPDAPVSRFVLQMQGGRKGLLENSRNLCRSTNRATVQMDAQNGRTFDTRPVLGDSCGKGKKGAKRRGRR